jgi:hypothetical protein
MRRKRGAGDLVARRLKEEGKRQDRLPYMVER